MKKFDSGDKRIPDGFDLPRWLHYPRLEEWYARRDAENALFREFGFDRVFTAFKNSIIKTRKN